MAIEIKRILVPIDFSEPAKAALEYAVFLGKQFNSTIDLLHAWVPPADTYPEMVAYVESDETDLKDAMASLIKQVGEQGISQVNGLVVHGEPSARIVRAAIEKQ